jgi:Na+-driven multidrug efflux pump
MAAQLMLLAAIFQFSDGVRSRPTARCASSDATLPMAITVFAYWGVGMPIGYWLAFHAESACAACGWADRGPDGRSRDAVCRFAARGADALALPVGLALRRACP